MSDTIQSVAAAEPFPGATETQRLTWSMGAIVGIASITAVAITISLLALYHAFLAQRSPRFGVVDINATLATSELVFTEMLSRPSTTDRERAQAYDLVKEVGSKMEKALQDIEQQCDCILLTKAAVIGAPLPDYSEELRRAMGVDKVDEAGLQAKLIEYAKNPGGQQSLAQAPLVPGSGVPPAIAIPGTTR